MIRILHIVPNLSVEAGMLSVVMNYYRQIDKTKINFDFWYLSDENAAYKEEIESLGGRAFYMPYRTFSFSDQKNIRDFFQSHKGEYTAVHCHPIWSSAVISKEAKKSGIRHIIQHVHSTKYSEKKLSAVRNYVLMRFVRFFASDYIACNEEAEALFGKKICKSGKVFILRNAVDLQKYAYDSSLGKAFREEYGIARETLVVGNVGRLSPEKNQLFLIDVFRELLKLEQDSKLIITGDGAVKSALEQAIIKNDLTGKVILTGRRSDINAVLSSFDVFLLPSFFEGTPVCAVEALANGLGCIVSDTVTKSIGKSKVEYLSLASSPLEWAKEAVRSAVSNRGRPRQASEELYKNGFDIKSEAFGLSEYYIRLE